MTTAYEVPADLLIDKLVEHIKNNVAQVTPPEWAFYVKTGSHAERPPQDKNWWYKRAASLIRKIYLYGPIGIGDLRGMYGGAKTTGYAFKHHRDSGGAAVRKVVQQLESAGLVTKLEKRGRILTGKGRSVVDRTSKEILVEIAKNQPELKKYL
ncbi:MAG: 30S ribosomal protein S19e [Nitrososphaeria archaeon]|jgi:small subunit ribosomal protein S19e